VRSIRYPVFVNLLMLALVVHFVGYAAAEDLPAPPPPTPEIPTMLSEPTPQPAPPPATPMLATPAPPKEPAPVMPVDPTPPGNLPNLHCMNLAQLDQLFLQGCVNGIPHGWLPGQVITFTNMPCPCLARWLADHYWQGKHVAPSGCFINQWRHGIKALHSCATIGPSLYDGKPALIFQYPWCTPLFGPMRDEYREVAPGVFLGRMYRHHPFVRFLGYNSMQLQCGSVAGATSALDAAVESSNVAADAITLGSPAVALE
jgi:hypothetical protein